MESSTDLSQAESAESRDDLPAPRSITLAALFAGLGFWVGVAPVGDNSFLVHLTTGRYILNEGFPRSDIYSFVAQGTRWVPQSWLAEVTYGVLYRHGEFGAIRVFTGVVAATLALTLFTVALRLTRDPLRAALVTMAAALVTMPIWGERPTLLGALCFGFLVLIVDAPGRWLGRAGPWLLVPLFWVWGNVHGSWLLGLAYVVLTLVGSALDDRALPTGRLRSVALGAGIGVLAIAANPYGLAILAFPFELSARSAVLSRVMEWKSPTFRDPLTWCFLGWAGAVFFTIGRATERRWRSILTAALFLGLAFWAGRNLLIAPIATLPILARNVACSDGGRPRLVFDRAFDRAVATAIVVLTLIAGVVRFDEPSFDATRYPVQAMQAVEREGLLGKRLVTTDGYGGYVIARYFPRQQVYYDDRYDMYPLAQSDDYFELLQGGPKWREALERAKADVVVWPKDKALAQLLAEDSSWRPLPVAAGKAAVFIRQTD